MSERIPFNKPYLTGKEAHYIYQAVYSGKISGNGQFTQRCQRFFEERYGFGKCLLTTSCTDALEMAALLADIQPGDEVIAPTYTFVSTVNAFVLRGARIVFADSQEQHPNLDPELVEPLIGPRTKALVAVHYAGVACDMERLAALAQKHGLFLIEDAAQAIDSFHDGRPLGSFGHMAAFSFHETKNIISGEGGMLVVNDESLRRRAEIIWEKGTNRAEFYRGEVNKYGWKDLGSSFLPSDTIAAFLFAQLENLDDIQRRRREIWDAYQRSLEPLERRGWLELPRLPGYATNNAHMFYLVCRDLAQRDRFLDFMRESRVVAVFHYLSLHESDYYRDKHDGRPLPRAARFNDCLVRLPLFYELAQAQQERVCALVHRFFEAENA